jgi:hypothetical protein
VDAVDTILGETCDGVEELKKSEDEIACCHSIAENDNNFLCSVSFDSEKLRKNRTFAY